MKKEGIYVLLPHHIGEVNLLLPHKLGEVDLLLPREMINIEGYSDQFIKYQP